MVAHLRAVSPHTRSLPKAAVDIDQVAQLNSEVGDQAGDVRGADLGVGALGYQRVLQAHDEAQQHHRIRHQGQAVRFNAGTKNAKHQKQNRLQQERAAVSAAQIASQRPTHHQRRGHGTAHEGQQGPQTNPDQQTLPQHRVVRHGRNHAAHVRGVHAHRQKASGIDGPGHKAQHRAQIDGRQQLLFGCSPGQPGHKAAPSRATPSSILAVSAVAKLRRKVAASASWA